MADGWAPTYNDRRLLRSLHIDPEPTLLDDVVDTLNAPSVFLPNQIVIGQLEARQIIERYGDLTIENWAKNRGLK